MFKKSSKFIICIFILFFINFTFANENIDNAVSNMSDEQVNTLLESNTYSQDSDMYKALTSQKEFNDEWNKSEEEDALQEKKDEKEARDKDCAAGWKNEWNCIDKANFVIDVDSISPWMSIKKWSTSKTINYALGTIIQKLMIGLGSLSLLIMTVWAWYIVLHGWQDELLNKWKSIFMSGIYAMLVALSSYYLIVIVRYVLYA